MNKEFEMTEETNQPMPISLSWEQVWLQAVLHPSPATFENLLKDPAATPGRAYKWMFFATMVIIVIAGPLLIFLDLDPQLTSLIKQNNTPISILIIVWVVLIPVGGLLSILGLMVEAGLFQWIAGRLGGTGSYARLVYTLAAFEAPLGIVTAVLGIIPYIGGIAQLLVFYRLLLDVIAIKAVNQFGWGKAVWCVVLPGLILLVLAILFGICMVAGLRK
jgi:hypothetical protein